MIDNNDRLFKKNQREKREFNKIKEKLFNMSLGENKEDFKKYLNIKRQKANYGTLTTRVYDLIKFIDWFPNKRILNLKEDEILNFFSDLDEDEIKYISTKKRKKKDISKIEESTYTYETKIQIKKSIKTYFRTLLGDYEFIKNYSNLKGLKNITNPVERPYIKFEECKQVLAGILNKERNIEKKLRDLFIYAFLFEMGCRGCELQAMKIKDIYFSEKENKWVAYIPKVKTQDRTIAIEIFETYITKYINYLINEKKMSLETPIIDLTSKTIRSIVNSRSIEFLGEDYKFVTNHILRHSSAFFFTKEKANLNYQDFTKRFGWSIKSKEAQRYFDKNRVITSEVVQSVSSSEIMKYETKYNEQDEKIKELENQEKENKKNLLEMQENLTKINKILESERHLNNPRMKKRYGLPENEYINCTDTEEEELFSIDLRNVKEEDLNKTLAEYTGNFNSEFCQNHTLGGFLERQKFLLSLEGEDKEEFLDMVWDYSRTNKTKEDLENISKKYREITIRRWIKEWDKKHNVLTSEEKIQKLINKNN